MIHLLFFFSSIYLEDRIKSCDPFKKMSVTNLQNSLKKEAEALKYALSSKTDNMKQRVKNVVTKTFNNIGLVVPYNKRYEIS